jgi:hypothetical protein
MSTSGSHDSFDGFLARLAELSASTVAMMVTSVDGRATIDGRVGELTGKPDQRVLLGLREHAAAVVIGSGTKDAGGAGARGAGQAGPLAGRGLGAAA